MAGAYALDMTAVLAMAGLSGPMSPETAALFELILPDVETAILKNLKTGDEA